MFTTHFYATTNGGLINLGLIARVLFCLAEGKVSTQLRTREVNRASYATRNREIASNFCKLNIHTRALEAGLKDIYFCFWLHCNKQKFKKV